MKFGSLEFEQLKKPMNVRGEGKLWEHKEAGIKIQLLELRCQDGRWIVCASVLRKNRKIVKLTVKDLQGVDWDKVIDGMLVDAMADLDKKRKEINDCWESVKDTRTKLDKLVRADVAKKQEEN
jgi:hypothetical protein